MATANNETVSALISQLQSDRNKIRSKLVELGLATSADHLERLATIIYEIVNVGAVSIHVKEGETYTIPKGFHDGSGTVSGVAGGGNYTLQSKTVTPTKVQQIATPDSGYFGLSDVVINAIPDVYQDTTAVTATADDVFTGKIFVASDGAVVTGTMPNNGAVTKTLNATSITYTIPKGYHSGSGKVSITLETKSVTPTKSTQEITPTDGKVLSKVTVAPIPAAYQDVTGVTAGAANVLDGKKFVDSTGKVVEGTMPNNGDVSGTIDGLTSVSMTVPAGYTTGGTISLTDDIEKALAAI
jgi:hypothetical protein